MRGARAIVSRVRRLIESLGQKNRHELKHAVGGRCEFDGQRYPLHSLEIHTISDIGPADTVVPGNIVILCRRCHARAHGTPPAITRSQLAQRVRRRPERVKREIRSALRRSPKLVRVPGIGAKSRSSH
ncbi:MAG: HNH endonuclease signature motif containing protein [Methanomicrobiaceae archaeon]|nr:HNH endonuclease signature motif containing protein [Methanomicrobiaceae archaeon]